MAAGPAAGLDALPAGTSLGGHLWHAARGDLLARAGRVAEAVADLDEAVRLAPTDQQRRALVRRRAEVGQQDRSGPG
jgi:RNA polymerase sigma-70 factor (ECF subfamily)